jgi:hypothetical protein
MFCGLFHRGVRGIVWVISGPCGRLRSREEVWGHFKQLRANDSALQLSEIGTFPCLNPAQYEDLAV